MRSITPDEMKALKAASRMAVKGAGGGASFRHVTRIGEARLSTCCSSSDELMDDFLPLDVALEADREAGAPIILEALARMQGFKLVKAADEADSGLPTHGDLLKVDRFFSEFLHTFFDALSDRHMSEGEKRLVFGKMEKAIKAMRDNAARAGVGG